MNGRNGMVLEPSILHRLELIKALLDRAELISDEPKPFCYLSLLGFHDAVEWFLQLAGEYLGIERKEPQFMDWWELISHQLNDSKRLGCKEQMRLLRDVRGNYKHRCIEPSDRILGEIKGNCRAFFRESTPLIFGLEFESISLLGLIESEDVRNYLISAQSNWQIGNVEESKRDLQNALQAAIDQHESFMNVTMGYRPHHFGQDMTFESAFHIFNAGDPIERALKSMLGSFIDKTKNSLDAIRSALKIISMGLDYKSYSIFKWLTRSSSRYSEAADFNEVAYRFCYDYIISSALHLQTMRVFAAYGKAENN